MTKNRYDILIAQSNGPGNSSKLLITKCRRNKKTKAKISHFGCSDKMKLFSEGPSGIEEVFATQNSVWTSSESGALLYGGGQGKHWRDNLPFTFEYKRPTN